MKFSTIAAAAVLLTTAGCVNHVWAPGPNASGTFTENSAKCRILARASNDAVGPVLREVLTEPGIATGLSIAIGTAVRTNANYNDCMEATGWTPIQ